MCGRTGYDGAGRRGRRQHDLTALRAGLAGGGAAGRVLGQRTCIPLLAIAYRG